MNKLNKNEIVKLKIRYTDCNNNFFLFISNKEYDIDLRINNYYSKGLFRCSIDNLNYPEDENSDYYFKQEKSLKSYLKSKGIKRVKFIR